MKGLPDIDIMRTILAKIEKTIATLFAKKIPFTSTHITAKSPLVSIIIVAHNALDELQHCITSLQHTEYSNYEIVVVNNNSLPEVQAYLNKAKRNGHIQHIAHSKKNLYFCGGNNLGVQHASANAELLVLLNSDTIILHPSWLKVLLQSRTPEGIVAFGSAPLPFRPDGWCYLIPKKLYEKIGGIDEAFKMNWGVTDLTERAARMGTLIRVILNYQKYIRHLGERSYTKISKNQQQNVNKPGFFALVRSPLWFGVGVVWVC